MKKHKNAEKLIGNQNAKKAVKKEKPVSIYIRLQKDEKDELIKVAGDIPLPILALQLLREYRLKNTPNK